MAPKTFDDDNTPQQLIRRNFTRHYRSSSTISLLPPIYGGRNSVIRFNRFNINFNNFFNFYNYYHPSFPSPHFILRRNRFITSSFITPYHIMSSSSSSDNISSPSFYDQRVITFTPSRRSSSRYSFASNGGDNLDGTNFNGNIIRNNFNNFTQSSSRVTNSSNISNISNISSFSSPFSFNPPPNSDIIINNNNNNDDNNNNNNNNDNNNNNVITSSSTIMEARPPSFNNNVGDYNSRLNYSSCYSITPLYYSYRNRFAIIPQQNVQNVPTILQSQFPILSQSFNRQQSDQLPLPQSTSSTSSTSSNNENQRQEDQRQNHYVEKEENLLLKLNNENEEKKKKRRRQKKKSIIKNKFNHLYRNDDDDDDEDEAGEPSDLYFLNLFVSMCDHINAEYFLHSWSKSDKCCAILRVPILKRSFGAFKPTKDLAKELVAEMAIEEFIKQHPDAACTVTKLRETIDDSKIKINVSVNNTKEGTSSTNTNSILTSNDIDIPKDNNDDDLDDSTDKSILSFSMLSTSSNDEYLNGTNSENNNDDNNDDDIDVEEGNNSEASSDDILELKIEFHKIKLGENTK